MTLAWTDSLDDVDWEELAALYRAAPEDFVVGEIPGFEPTGQGEHLLLTVEKRGANTAHIAKRLARWAGITAVAAAPSAGACCSGSRCC